MAIKLEVKERFSFIIRADEPVRIEVTQSLLPTGVVAHVYRGFNDENECKAVGSFDSVGQDWYENKDWDTRVHPLMRQPEYDMCYTAVVEPDGICIGLAKWDVPGYQPLPEYGRFDTYDQAKKHAAWLNSRIFVSEQDALAIVLSSMRAQSYGS